MFEIKGKYTNAKIMINDVENECISQLTNLINHPAFTNPVAVMPDCHAGKGSCIGFTMKMTDKIIPNVVSVDIGCGMIAFNIGKELPVSLELLDTNIRSRIPFGFDVHDRGVIHMKNDFPWREANAKVHNYALKMGITSNYPNFDMPWFEAKAEQLTNKKSHGKSLGRFINSIGTLGGGNHFIEVGLDIQENYWITIHTGSRNFGKCVCDYWQNHGIHKVRKEKQEMLKNRIDEIRATYTGMEIKNQIRKARKEFGLDEKVSNELQYLENEDAFGYLYDMIFAQTYAEVNRKYIMEQIVDVLKVDVIDSIETIHNFIDFRDLIIRKGAIRSYVGERMIIPFSPSYGILICEGKSNPDFNYSAPHGAGRLMSRAKAKKTITDEMANKAMEGIYASEKPKDESPLAYKDPKIIEEALEPTAKILNRIKPIMNMKAGS